MQSIDPKQQLPHSYGHQPNPPYSGHHGGAPISPIGPRQPGDSFEAMPSQRGRFYYDQTVAPSQSWLHREPAPAPSFGHLAAASQLDFLYRENARWPDKVPFLGFFFDRNMLRNEFERFVLLKLSGAAESELREAIHPSAVEPGKEAETALYAHAKATRVAFQKKALGGREDGVEEEKKPFFDGESDGGDGARAGEEEAPSWRENEPNVSADTNRRTFGAGDEQQQPRRRWQNGAEKPQTPRWKEAGEREQQQPRWKEAGEREQQQPRWKEAGEREQQQPRWNEAGDKTRGQVQRGRGTREWRGRVRGVRGVQRGRGGFQQRSNRADVNDDDNYYKPTTTWQQPAGGNEASASEGETAPVEEAGWGKAVAKPEVSFGAAKDKKGKAGAKGAAGAAPAAKADQGVSFGDGEERGSAVVFG